MTQKEYNIGLVMFFLIIIIGCIFLTITLTNELKKITQLENRFTIYRSILYVCSTIIVIVLMVYMACSVSYNKEETKKIQIVDIAHVGSYAGLMDSYELCFKDEKGGFVWLSTPLFASNDLKRNAEALSVGDTIIVVYVDKTQVVYRIEPV